ncbi:2-isopropylmalate synthase/homocitrate synthase family protein [Syntrophobotulus glycolicus DSM 8271]|uniref:Citramalate synthase n=1 Tax=Syntrophobotulus glycolicus (strain DSM 8271 / FlGlyR) TaxID=645991 RepID=F0SVI7_SYNGF|nr:citramalate synthase [Syntrophobotulus glycolicus]ADY56760.1 2-isopropylmalate synthase/homocitrate synthase family protein [Syntrophobotulus glycolicus DSM 8271]
MSGKKAVYIYDTTLRDGAQGEGVHFSVKDKMLYLAKIMETGVHYIEAGWPGSNPKDDEFFNRIASSETIGSGMSKIAAFGSTCRVGEEPENSEILSNLLSSCAPAVTIFGKAWKLHVKEVLRTDHRENWRMIRESVRFLSAGGKEVFFDAEHFFDGFADDPDFALACLEAALEGGATGVVLCDTNGGAFPDEIRKGVLAAGKAFVPRYLGIHAHNDGGMAVANSLTAVQAGANQIQGSWNGFGERCGNANLSTLVPWLQLKLGYQVLGAETVNDLSHLSRYVAELANYPFDEKQPFVGKSAFAHKAGMHVDAVIKNHKTFEHIDPSAVGNERRILVSEQSGKANLCQRMKKFQPEITKDDPLVEKAMDRIKQAEKEGFQYDTAEGSLDLLLLDIMGLLRRPFVLEDYHVWSDPLRGELDSVAVVKVRVGDRSEHIAGEGDGPVHALDKALRRTLSVFFPIIEESELSDYKVRVIDGSHGTGATVRVVVETRWGLRSWGTVGVATNILRASAMALLDALYIVILSQSEGKTG